MFTFLEMCYTIWIFTGGGHWPHWLHLLGNYLYMILNNVIKLYNIICYSLNILLTVSKARSTTPSRSGMEVFVARVSSLQ